MPSKHCNAHLNQNDCKRSQHGPVRPHRRRKTDQAVPDLLPLPDQSEPRQQDTQRRKRPQQNVKRKMQKNQRNRNHFKQSKQQKISIQKCLSKENPSGIFCRKITSCQKRDQKQPQQNQQSFYQKQISYLPAFSFANNFVFFVLTNVIAHASRSSSVTFFIFTGISITFI